MVKRILFAIPALGLLACVVFLPGAFGDYFGRVVVSLVGLFCMHEMLRVLGADGTRPVKSVAYLFSLLAWPVYEYAGSWWAKKYVGDQEPFGVGFWALCAMLVLAVMAVFLILVVTKRTGEAGIRTIYALIYPGLFYAFLLAIICIKDAVYARFMFFLVFVGAALTDTFAYFGGMIFGKHKLAPQISPKKTVEGAVIGGVFGSLGVLLAGVIFQQYILDPAAPRVPIYRYAILGLALGILSQVGDLTASMIKRQFGVKDYGNIMGAHGGPWTGSTARYS